MNVLIVSQCSKNALTETRRILDQFAERKGDRTWQTAITQEGLTTLRQMLRKTARRNTAIACHWIKSGNQAELLWIVGSLKAFNQQGSVATNTTSRDILRSQDENQWHTIEGIALLAGIAGLFHDFGKANRLFQHKLAHTKIAQEPVRHEWVSLRLFQAFVGEASDQEWLGRLAKLEASDDAATLQALIAIQDAPGRSPNPFAKLKGRLAQVVGWLIVSHHRLPKFPVKKNELEATQPRLSEIEKWMTGKIFRASWNSPQSEGTWSAQDWQKVWDCQHGTPIRSYTWRKKAQSLAERALKHQQLFEREWMKDSFSSHLARLTLMLADHYYSAGGIQSTWQDPAYASYANTDHTSKSLKQKLDEHNVGVAHHAFLLAKNLPKLRQTLPAITRHKGFKQRSKDPRFAWQDEAFALAQGLAMRSNQQGFFGVNMASTGCGKTLANARIMYGLADEKLGCRFSIALGLRTLTLQTGDALRARLRLESDDLAVLVGSQAVQQLHTMRQAEAQESIKIDSKKLSAEQAGSESAEDFFAESQYLRYDGSLDDGHLRKWLKPSPKLHQLLSAPVLVCTIDHLIPATEGERGGKQIAPMLRLLTADLVLDEPDDFDLADLPALSRLVNWAGMLGSRVLLSSATLAPALVQALFAAYASGRKQYAAACGLPDAGQNSPNICCAWFDEFSAKHSDVQNADQFSGEHQEFVAKRIAQLDKKNQVLRRAELLPIQATSQAVADVLAAMSAGISQAMLKLHANNQQVHAASGKRVSIGLVRMANIKPMVALAQHILQQTPAANHRLHFCIYHSQHPLIVRSEMEKHLDLALTRYQKEQLWQVPAIAEAIKHCKEENQVFVVFATAVAEVGRDHDYDWAIAEPSSMRSIIQLAGRIQRHRQQSPASTNMLILNKNFRALKGEQLAYTKPGFESAQFFLRDKDLRLSLREHEYRSISAKPRIQANAKLDSTGNLVDLEHAHLQEKLFGSSGKVVCHAALWWQEPVHWCAEIQARSRFRQSTPDEEFALMIEEEGELCEFYHQAENGEYDLVEESRFQRSEISLAEGVQAWLAPKLETLLCDIAESEDLNLMTASKRFAQLRLCKLESFSKWCYHPLFGVYGALE